MATTIDHGDRCVHQVGAAGERAEHGAALRRALRLAVGPPPERDDRVGADDHRLRKSHGDGLSFREGGPASDTERG